MRKGKMLGPLQGIDFSPLFTMGKSLPHRPLFFEHQGNKAIIMPPWKAVAKNGTSWELYPYPQDRTEQDNKAGEYRQEVRRLKELYLDWAKSNKVQNK